MERKVESKSHWPEEGYRSILVRTSVYSSVVELAQKEGLPILKMVEKLVKEYSNKGGDK